MKVPVVKVSRKQFAMLRDAVGFAVRRISDDMHSSQGTCVWALADAICDDAKRWLDHAHEHEWAVMSRTLWHAVHCLPENRISETDRMIELVPVISDIRRAMAVCGSVILVVKDGEGGK